MLSHLAEVDELVYLLILDVTVEPGRQMNHVVAEAWDFNVH